MKIKSTNGFANQFRHSLFFNYALKNSILKNATQYWTITNHNNVSFCKFFKFNGIMVFRNDLLLFRISTRRDTQNYILVNVNPI